MSEPGFQPALSQTRIAIWGLGLMGGSLALALKGKCASIIGIDTDLPTLKLAQEKMVVDEALSLDAVRAAPKNFLAGIDLIVLAVPARAILGLLEELPSLIPDPAVILDLGSTKVSICQAMESLPARFDPVGGHPMCGKENSSLYYAEADLYKDSPFALVELERTTARAHSLVLELVQAVQACPLWLKADIHDRWVASTSHVPFLTAWALSMATPEEAFPLVGPGFRSSTRLAGSSPNMMVDIFATNKANIRVAIRALIENLERIDQILEFNDFEELASQFGAGVEKHKRLSGRSQGT